MRVPIKQLPISSESQQVSLRSGRVLDYLILTGGLLVGLAAAFALRTGWAKEAGGAWLWLLFLLAAGLAGYGLRRIDRWLPDAAPAPRPAALRPAGWQLAGRALLAAAGLLTAGVVIRLWPDYRDWAGTPAAWVLAMTLAAAAGYLMGGFIPGQNKNVVAALHIPAWLEILLAVLIGGLAVYLRLHRLGDIPSGIYVDETNGALDALHILEGNGASPFATGWYGTPNGYIFYMAGLIKLFGATAATLKAISLIPAILTVWAMFPLGRLLFGSLGGLSAMFLVAVSRWHLSMSRWGWNETAPLLFQVLGTFFLVRGLRDRRASDFVISGLISGLMMHTYLSSRLALATLGAFVLVYLLLGEGGPARALRTHSRGLALFMLAFVIAFAPLAVTHITDPFTFNNRVQEISIFREISASGSLQPLLSNLVKHLVFFHQVGDLQGKHNLPGEPQVDPFTGLLFVVGLAYGLWRPRDWRYWLLWLWITFGLAGGVFSSSHEAPQSYRTLTVVPGVALLAGSTAARFGRASATLLHGVGRRGLQKVSGMAGIGMLCILLGASGTWETSIYFGKQAASLAYQAGFNLVENGVAREVLSAADSGMEMYLSPRFYDYSPVRYLVYGKYKEEWDQNTLDNPPYRLFRPEQDLPLIHMGGDALILLDLYYLPVMDYLLSYYPHAAIEVVRWRDQVPLYIRIQVPGGDMQALNGLEAHFTRRDGSQETRRDTQVDERWDGKDILSAGWSGQIRLPKSGEYSFNANGSLALAIDGKPWSGARYLCAGLHAIEVTATQVGAGRASLGWSTPLGSEAVISPEYFYNIPGGAQGLTGYYYPNPTWEGQPVCQRMTPFLLMAWPDQEPLPPPFSARFKGYLRITEAGSYRLHLTADDGARLVLDGSKLGEGLVPNKPNEFKVEVYLEPGDHPIQIDYFQAGGGSALEFTWQKDNGPEQPVPPSALVPDQGIP